MMQSASPHTISLWDALALRLDTNRPRPRVRPGIKEYRLLTARGVPYLIVRSPDGRTFLRLVPWQSAVLRAMDGTHTMRDLLLIHLEQRGVLEPTAVTALVALLYAHGFVEGAGGDCYAELAVRLRPGGHSSAPRRAIAAIGRSWELPLLVRAVALLCTACARLPRIRTILALVLLLGAAGILTPVLAVFARRASLGAAPGTLLAIGLALWTATVLYALGAGIGGSLVGCPPRRAGVRLFAGIPVPWLDARECLVAGRDGLRAVWLAGPLALLCAAGVAGLAAMAAPANPLTLALALTWALPAVWLLAPPSLPDDEAPDAGPSVAALRRDRWWLQRPAWPALPPPGDSPARSYSILAGLLWLCSLLALVASSWRAGLPGLLTAPWHLGSVLGAALVVVLAAHVAACATVQFILPALRRWGTPEAMRQFRERHPPAAIRRRLAILDRCEALSGLTAEQRLTLAHRVTEVQYPNGFDVVVQGEVGDDYYILMEGTAEAIDEGGPTVLEQYGPGDSFGKYALIYHALRAATIRATSDLRLLRVNRTIFDLYLARRFVLQERLAALADERRILTGVPLLRNLDAQALDLLLPLLISERHEPGAVIIRQGEPGEHFYIVKSGTVEIVDESHTPPRRLNVLGNGEYFGEIALLLDQPRVATVRALVEVTVWRLSRTDFNLVLGRYLGLDASLAGTGQARLAANSATDA